MDSRNLTIEQVRRLSATVGRYRNLPSRLLERIATKAFPDADPLKVAVQGVDDAVDAYIKS